MPAKPSNFLADAVKSNHNRVLGYRDGFRFGIGFMVAMLLVWTVLGALCWAAMWLLKLV